MKNLCVQYGCGFSAPDCWRNFDSSPTLRIERIPLLGKLFHKNKIPFPNNVEYGDIVNGLPIPEQSCKAVYCSHVLEHLSLTDFRVALKNTRNMFQIGGIFRMVLPDLEHAINNYVCDVSSKASYIFLKETSLGKITRNKTLKSFFLDWLEIVSICGCGTTSPSDWNYLRQDFVIFEGLTLEILLKKYLRMWRKQKDGKMLLELSAKSNQ